MSNPEAIANSENRELSTKAQVLAEVCAATVQIAGLDDLQAVLQRIAEVARTILQADYGVLVLQEGMSAPDIFMSRGANVEEAQEIDLRAKGFGQLTAVMDNHEPVRVADLRADGRFGGLLATHPRIERFLGVPIVVDGEIFGRLYVAREKDQPPFSSLDEQLIVTLSTHASVAIKNNDLLHFNRRQKDHLERQNQQLATLHRATMAIAGELSLENVLQQIIDSARDLVQAQYGALGVPNQEGSLETFVTSGMPSETVDAIPHLPQGMGLLGAIFQERKSIRIPRISDDPRSVGFPANHPPMEPFLGVPVIAGGEVLGNLYFTNKLSADSFSASDQQVVEMLASHAAIAIQNARLYEQVGRLAIVEERNRIGMDLHDGVIQSIFAVGLTLESAKLVLHEQAHEADALLEEAISGLNDTIRDIRNYILDLRPHRFRGNLEAGLGRLMREFQANTMVPVAVSGDLSFTGDLPPDVARAIFLTTQEALANIARHAKASNVHIDIQRQDNLFLMTIEDNGQGFDMRDRNYSIGHGLSNMRTRAEDLNGVYKVFSKVGEGTRITLKLPLR